MFFQIAFILLCSAVLIHLSSEMIKLHMVLREQAKMDRLRSFVDWTAPRQKKKSKFW